MKLGPLEAEFRQLREELEETKQQVDVLEADISHDDERYRSLVEGFDPHAPVADLASTRESLKAMAGSLDDLGPVRRGLAPDASASELYAAAEIARARRDPELYDDLVTCLNRLAGDADLGGIRLHTVWTLTSALHRTLVATVVGISSGMPIGILLAIGRRSELPVIKGFCVVFIEFVRGVPLISLLLFSSFILPLLFPLSVETPQTLTRAMIVITLFSAAYIAEIVRGGLQAVPKGQTEAAQASGMSAAKIQRLIVMPQALRAVIPAMVGQFISLFKDTSLIATIGVAEFFQYAAIANSQPDFLGKGLQLVTYSIIAIGYWSFAYTMSKESRRLEVQLGVGVR